MNYAGFWSHESWSPGQVADEIEHTGKFGAGGGHRGECCGFTGAVCRLVTIKDEANREDTDGASREMADDVLDRSEVNSSTQYPSPRSKNSRSSEKDSDSRDLEARMIVCASEQGHNLEGPSIVVMWAESDCVGLLVELRVGEHT